MKFKFQSYAGVFLVNENLNPLDMQNFPVVARYQSAVDDAIKVGLALLDHVGRVASSLVWDAKKITDLDKVRFGLAMLGDGVLGK